MNPAPRKSKSKSLADYLVRYDLATILEEAKNDYSQTTAGGPRLLDQKEIAARFRKNRAPKSPTNE